MRRLPAALRTPQYPSPAGGARIATGNLAAPVAHRAAPSPNDTTREDR